jgi:hypothetical protein
MKGPSDLPGCLNNYCADHLDFHSYRQEKNGPNLDYTNIMETSVGSPDTWRGVCLARPGVAANTETGGTYCDQCKSQNTLTVYYLDGIWNGRDEIEYKDFECPNHYACSSVDGSCNNYCRYSCTLDTHCASGYYCTGGHCCAVGSEWNTASQACVPHDPCYNTPCSFNPPNYGAQSGWWTSTNCINSALRKACCYVGKVFGKDPWYAYTSYNGVVNYQVY